MHIYVYIYVAIRTVWLSNPWNSFCKPIKPMVLICIYRVSLADSHTDILWHSNHSWHDTPYADQTHDTHMYISNRMWWYPYSDLTRHDNHSWHNNVCTWVLCLSTVTLFRNCRSLLQDIVSFIRGFQPIECIPYAYRRIVVCLSTVTFEYQPMGWL